MNSVIQLEKISYCVSSTCRENSGGIHSQLTVDSFGMGFVGDAGGLVARAMCPAKQWVGHNRQHAQHVEGGQNRVMLRKFIRIHAAKFH